MNTCNGIDGGFTPTDGWLLMRERRTAAKGPLCSGCCAIRRGPCRCPPTPARHLMMPWGVVRFNIRRTTQQTDYKRIKHFQSYRIANSENG